MVLKVGLIGYRNHAQRLIDIINSNHNSNLMYIFHPTKKFDDPLFTTNFDNLLTCDVVVVSSPNNTHFNYLQKLQNFKGYIFCEKPPSRDVAGIIEVINEEKKHPGQKLMYGFNHRYHDSILEALSIVRSKELGEIINLRGVYGKSQLITFNQTDWRTKRDIAGGGVLLDQGIHMVDLMRLFAGEFVDIYSFIENSYWNYDVEDNAYALMRTKNGTVAMLNSSATQWRHRFHLDINLEKGSLVLGGILSGSKSYGVETLTIVYANPEDDQGDPKMVTTNYNIDPSWCAEIKEFSDCILNNRKITSGTAHDALQTMKLVYKIYYADKKWQQTYNIKNPDIE